MVFKTINTSFIISLILLFISVSDLFISEKTKKLIQNKFESFTLWFSYINPIKVLRFTFNSIFIKLMLVLSLSWMIIDRVNKSGTLNTGFLLEEKYPVVFILIFILYSVLVYKFLFDRFINWMLKSNKLFPFIYKFILHSIILFLYLIISIITDDILDNFISNLGDRLFLFLLLPVILLYFSLAFGVILSLFFSFLIIILDKIIFPLLKFLFWKISEYNNGVLSAIFLIISFSLGLYILFNES